MSCDIDTIKTRLLHCTREYMSAIFKHQALLNILVHLRTSSIIYAHPVDKRTRLTNLDDKRCLLARLVIPVLMVRFYSHHNIVTTNLCGHLEGCHYHEEKCQ